MRSNTPYIQSPHTNACALASFTMVAQTFFPDTTLDDMKQLLRWQDGKVVWGVPFYLWLIKRGIKIVQFDSVRYDIWGNEGFLALSRVLSPQTFNFYKDRTHHPDSYQDEIRELMNSKNFVYHLKQPQFQDLRDAVANADVCEALVDSRAMNGLDGFSLHRVVVLGFEESDIILHDPVNPGSDPRPSYHMPLRQFLNAWPSLKGGPDSCELCAYYADKEAHRAASS